MTRANRVFGVFGANGFIGRNLVRRILADKQQVVAFGRSFPSDFEEGIGGSVETRVIDFADAINTHAMLQGVTDVVQLINSSSPRMANSRTVQDIHANIVPHVAFIESCLMTEVSSFVFVSSGGTVYGEPRYLPIDELHPLSPINSYGITKMVVESYLRMLASGTTMNAISLRASNPFGPGQIFKKGQGLIASILRNQTNDLPTTVFGDGTMTRDYLYIDDLTDAILSALNAAPMNETINIGSGVGRSVLDVVSAVECALGTKINVEFVPSHSTDAQANVLDCSKALAMLGWSAKTPFCDALQATVNRWRTGQKPQE